MGGDDLSSYWGKGTKGGQFQVVQGNTSEIGVILFNFF